MTRTPSLMALGIALLTALTSPSLADAQTVPVNACSGAKARCVGGHVKDILRCHQQAESRGAAVDPLCVQKGNDKLAACVAKAEARPPCLTTGDGSALANADDAYVQYLVPKLDPAYPAPIANKCSAAKKKAVATTVASRLLCLSKAFKRAPGTVDATCLAKAESKLAAALTKAETKPPCLTTGDAAALEDTVDAFFADRIAALSGPGGLCGNGVNDPGEACDVSAPIAGWTGCGAGYFCSACSCTCPTRYEIALDADDPATVLDLGWTGTGHRQALATGNTITLGITGCAGTARPCGSCNLTGPVANRSGKITNRRCTNDTSIHCTSDAPCSAGGGTCAYFFGSWHPRSGGGIAACIAHQIEGPVGGTVDVENGETTLAMSLKRSNYNALTLDTPCPRCVDDPSNNDGIADGTCSGGLHDGQSCDGNAEVTDYPDHGVTSLDCPVFPGLLITELSLALESSTQQVVRTVTASSPNCIGTPGEKCLCDTCNSVNAEPCSADSDCPVPPGPIGPKCGGLRCMSGANAGTPCTVHSECPGGQCGRPGEPAKPSACLDDTNTPGVFDCVDTAPVDGEGECTYGPVTASCTVASGHPQRGCLTDADCGGAIDSCESRNRACFLTGSAPGFGLAGTGTLVADGAADPPVGDVAHPTLAAVGCVAPTGFSLLNNTSGFPGPLRLTQKVTTTTLP